MSDNYERRGTDGLLVDMHGMLKAHIAHFEDHIQKDEENHQMLLKRLEPIEELNNFARVLLKVGAAVVALGGIGGITAWLRYAAAQVPRP